MVPSFAQRVTRGMIAGWLCLVPSAPVWADDPSSPATVQDSADNGTGWRLDATFLEEFRSRSFGAPVGSVDQGEVNGVTQDDQVLRLLVDGSLSSPSNRFGLEWSLPFFYALRPESASLQDPNQAKLWAYRNPWWDAYSLWAEVKPGGVWKRIRAGRQVTETGLPLTFDGLSVQVALPQTDWSFLAFGGRSVHFFELASDRFEDWIASLGIGYRPSPRLRLDVDYRYLQEDIPTKESNDKLGIRDNSYGLALRWMPIDSLWFKFTARGVNADPANLGATVRWTSASGLAGVDLNVQAQPTSLNEISDREDPYTSILGSSLPFLRWGWDGWTRFELQQGSWGFRVGGNGRQLLKGEEGPFNRNVGRAFLTVEETGIGLKGVYANLTAEQIFNTGKFSDEGFTTFGGALGYESKKTRSELGSYYQRFKYNYYQRAEELSDVQTTYASTAFWLNEVIRVKLRYEFERYDRDVHTVTVTILQAI